jgi:hypothetical protein
MEFPSISTLQDVQPALAALLISATVYLMSQSTPPPVRLIELLMGQVVSRLVHVAATLNLADLLASGPRSAEELAGATSTDARSLYRVMRTLASLGVFSEGNDHRFRLQPLGEALKSTEPGRATALLFGGEVFARSLEHMLYSVRTGKTGFEKAFGSPLFDWLGSHPEDASLFSQTMLGFHGTEPAAVAAAYDFSPFKTILDVGGSTGNLLSTILLRFERPRGILFDLPHVVREAPAVIEQRGLTGRVDIVPGSFFEQVPAGADACILSHVIHDWTEEQCAVILSNCRRAMPRGGRLLIIEMVLPAGDTPHPGKMLDMVMLATPGGQERTEPEYAALLEKSGFRLTRVVPTESAVSVVEAVLS